MQAGGYSADNDGSSLFSFPPPGVYMAPADTCVSTQTAESTIIMYSIELHISFLSTLQHIFARNIQHYSSFFITYSDFCWSTGCPYVHCIFPMAGR
jgi:hypothetical protein